MEGGLEDEDLLFGDELRDLKGSDFLGVGLVLDEANHEVFLVGSDAVFEDPAEDEGENAFVGLLEAGEVVARVVGGELISSDQVEEVGHVELEIARGMVTFSTMP